MALGKAMACPSSRAMHEAVPSPREQECSRVVMILSKVAFSFADSSCVCIARLRHVMVSIASVVPVKINTFVFLGITGF